MGEGLKRQYRNRISVVERPNFTGFFCEESDCLELCTEAPEDCGLSLVTRAPSAKNTSEVHGTIAEWVKILQLSAEINREALRRKGYSDRCGMRSVN